MTYHSDKSATGNESNVRQPRSRGWGIPMILGAFVLAVFAIIFVSAGPDRTRTADYNTPNSQPAGINPPATGETRGTAAAPVAPTPEQKSRNPSASN